MWARTLRRNGVAIIVNRVGNAVLGCNLKNNRMISVHFQGKSFNITVFQVSDQTTDTKEAEADRFYEDLHEFLKVTPEKKKSLFHHRGLECKSKKSRYLEYK